MGKASYQNTHVRVLLPLIDSHGVQTGAANARCILGQLRATPQCTPTLLSRLRNTWSWYYFTQTGRQEFNVK